MFSSSNPSAPLSSSHAPSAASRRSLLHHGLPPPRHFASAHPMPHSPCSSSCMILRTFHTLNRFRPHAFHFDSAPRWFANESLHPFASNVPVNNLQGRGLYMPWWTGASYTQVRPPPPKLMCLFVRLAAPVVCFSWILERLQRRRDISTATTTNEQTTTCGGSDH
ncbi:hypothetical protein EX30DRAFT_587 [Ascodesmis nigricans]|uniref:Uncharacterized protein n=1 Tax=Ascodesmis nigricans TaxID=341454 RepID=A0A4S2N5V7_9PEZI|nr:hypothetical protein EX30DRAFT_587 [Ascodesmis nigricans]